MKEQDQIKALAELDGCDCADWGMTRHTSNCAINGNKPYLTSYDAIIPLIQKLGLWSQIMQQMVAVNNPTPAQLCEALLKSVGKWME
jgi:hypothetical protein